MSTCPVRYSFNKSKINIQNISSVFWFITVRPELTCSNYQNLLLVSQFSRGLLKSFCREQFSLSARAQSKDGSEYGHIYDKYPLRIPSGMLAVLPRQKTGTQRVEHQDEERERETKQSSDTQRRAIGK